jgi:23S rRNA (uracil1939-C5)-methyltransferase
MRRFKPKNKAALPPDITVEIEKFGYDGRGIARHQGRVVMVSGALPGEHCVVKIEQANSKLWQGVATKISSYSNDRETPVCQHYEQCGGCQLQHVSHQSQIELKQQAITEQLHRQGFQNVELESPVVSESFQYRHRARFHVSKKGDIGFHSEKANQVVPVKQCPVLTPQLHSSFNELTVSAPLIGISQLEVVIDDFGNTGLAVVKGSKEALVALNEWAVNIGWVVDSALNYKAGDFEVHANPGGFTQVNRKVNQSMAERMFDWLNVKPNDRVLDLFCGNGNLSIPLAAQVESVLGFESNQEAIGHARGVAASNARYRVKNLFTSDLHDAVSEEGEQPTMIILDPPRAGAERVCETVSKLQSVKKIAYISCDPATLARDLHILARDQWHLRKVALVDMFPQTRHIETMVLLEK